MSTRKRKILTGLSIFAALVIVAGVFFKYYWIEHRLPEIINEKNDSPYYITYKDLDVSLLSGSLRASGIVVIPKKALTDSIHKSGIYATVKAVEVRHFSIWKLLFSDKLKADKIIVTEPDVVVHESGASKKNYSKSLRSGVVEPFGQVISVSEVELANGNVTVLKADGKMTVLRARNVSVALQGIVINDEVAERKIPFSYSTYSFSCDSAYYKPNSPYHVKTGRINTTSGGFELDDLEYLCDLGRREFVSTLSTERDMYNIKAKKLRLEDLKWGFREDDSLFVHSSKLQLEEVNANIYRDKRVADDPRKKKLYNALLRELSFDLKIDTLKLLRSTLEYEEQVGEGGPGKLRWQPFNLIATHIYSGFERTQLPDVVIDIDARFMDVSPMNAHWTLNVLDKTDGFHIKGSIKSFPVERISTFSKPYMNFTGEGVLDEVYFDFTGNDERMDGNFAINYDDLKFTVYQKNDRKKKNKFLTAVAGIFIKNDTDEKVKHTAIDVEREKDKSFYNMFWKGIADGLKKILL